MAARIPKLCRRFEESTMPLDLTGQTFGRWSVLCNAGRKINRSSVWVCHCECGTIREVIIGKLRSGHSKSCGCLHKEFAKTYSRTHGKSYTREHRIWRGMLDRCSNPRNSRYDKYGGRGITVCERWVNDFSAFLADMGEAPNRMMEIDRIDNERGYEPRNCRWATRKQQNLNKRNNRRLSFSGLTMTVTEWAERIGIARRTIHQRLRRGWPVARALSDPLGTR